MDKLFKYITVAIISCLLISALLHVALYASDSEDYRRWVTVQISIQVFSVFSLLFVLKRNITALILFFIASVAFTYINAIYTNYAHEIENIVSFIVFWSAYGYVLFKSWAVNTPNKASKPTTKSASA
jgi:hypothetical protein